MEHEFRISGYTDGLCPSEWKRKPYFSDTGCRHRQYYDIVDRRACDRIACATDNLAHERQDMEPSWQAPALFFDRSRTCLPCTGYNNKFSDMDICHGDAVDHGCLDKYFHGTIQGIRRRHASVKTANDRVCHAELLHRHRC